MNKIKFKVRVNRMAWLSGIGIISLGIAIIGLLFKLDIIFIAFMATYILCRILGNMLWRCPKCKAKLPKGNTSYINNCAYCNYDLKQ